MAIADAFVVLQRSDGSKVACQVTRILFFIKAEHGCVLTFGGGTQLNVKETFEEIGVLVGAASLPAPVAA
jgi:hypothetical protein